MEGVTGARGNQSSLALYLHKYIHDIIFCDLINPNFLQRCFQSSGDGNPAVEQDDLSDFDGDCAVGKGQEATLLASLLDGSLVAIGKASGKVAWSLADEPVRFLIY